MVVLHDAHERHDHAPCDHNRRQPAGWAQLLQEQVRRDLECRVGEEEGSQAPIVLVRLQPEIFLEAFDFGVADVATWDSQSW